MRFHCTNCDTFMDESLLAHDDRARFKADRNIRPVRCPFCHFSECMEVMME